MKYKWKVAEKPTGLQRVAYLRGWPTAHYINGEIAAAIYCDCVGYSACTVKSGDHPPLTIRVADHSVKPWQWRTIARRANTLQQAKDILKAFLARNPHYMPKPVVPLRRRVR